MPKRSGVCSHILVAVLILVFITAGCCERYYTKTRMLELREEVRGMFQHAYDGYLRHASDYDELRPLTCDGVDTWGSYSLTLIDALDTLATMGNFSEFRRVAKLLESKMDFDKNINVSVFETNIRIVGGFLSAHLMSKRAGLADEGWPCEGPLLRLAEDVARRLLPAFDTVTGMPYGTVNLRYGVPKGETSVTCTAGVGTFLIEFGTLSRLTGNPIFEEVAVNAVYALWERRSAIGLFGNHIDVQTGRWTALDAGIGAGVDSFFEYLVKGSIMLNRPDLLQMFQEARRAIDKYLKRDDWYVWAGMNKGQVTLPVFQSLEAFWPGLLSLIGDTGPAIRTLSKYSSVWRKYGFLPEFFNIPTGEASPNRESYPLRPELAESLMYLYRATKNQFLLEMGENMLQSIEFSAKTKCGYATIRNVVTHEKENRMESFFLAETTKYLYLLFDEDNFLHSDAGERLQTEHGECVIHGGPHIFNTEAHPMDTSALYCCHDLREDIYEDLDLSIYRDEVLLKAERLKRQEELAQSQKYQCSVDAAVEQRVAAKQAAAKSTNATQSSVAVDIEVFDEDNNPAGELLIENFERIKEERQSGAAAHEQDNTLRNQLTVTDLDEFFSIKREHFTHLQHVLDYVVAFMRNYTLDAGFISGLQIFDKNVTAVLGAVVEKEYEGRMRTLWELYELQQQYAVNAVLVTRLGLIGFDDENRGLLDNVLSALDANATAAADMPPGSAIQQLIKTISASQVEFEQALVNTTAMQEFLLKILRNGTLEKKRNYKPLLNNNEISNLVTSTLDDEARRRVFSNVRRIVELKKRMIDTFERLQTLMEEGNKQGALAAKAAVTEAPLDTAPTPAAQEQQQQQQQQGETNKSKQHSETAMNQKTDSAGSRSNADNTVESVWSQLVQTILRKTTMQRSKFDEDELLLKTRKSMQKFASKPQKYELFSCQSPQFIERFAYREFYP